MYIKTLEELKILANRKMSVCQLHGKIFSRDFLPARVLLNMSGEIIYQQLRNSLIIYKPKGKKNAYDKKIF